MFVFMESRKSGLIKSCSCSEDLSTHKILLSHVDWCKFCIHLSSLKIPQSLYSKDPLNKMIIQLKLVGISTLFHRTKLRLSKCNGWWIITIKQDVNCKFQLPTMFVLFVIAVVVLFKVVHHLKIYQNKKLHGPTLTSASFAPISEVWTSAIFEVIAKALKIMASRSLQWHDLPTEFHKNLPIGSNTQTDRMIIYLISLHFSFRKESKLKKVTLTQEI
jgi:hypothetical protein